MSQCQVCDDQSGGVFVGVASLPGVAMSVGWCRNCLDSNAVPPWVAQHWLEDAGGGDIDALADWVFEMTVWHGGRYQPVREFITTVLIGGES